MYIYICVPDILEPYRALMDTAVATAPMPSSLGDVPGKFIVVGDTHGQLQDVLHIFHEHGAPSAQEEIIYNSPLKGIGVRHFYRGLYKGFYNNYYVRRFSVRMGIF